MNESYLLKKLVDWSALNFGINIPVSLQGAFCDSLNIIVRKGETQQISLLLDGIEYSVALSNINFDPQKYPGHKELLQLRWSSKSDIARKLQSIFSSSFRYLVEKRALATTQRQKIMVPLDQQEHLVLYVSNVVSNTMILECFTYEDIVQGKKTVQNYDELHIEQLLQAKDDAELIQRPQLVKLRKLDHTIGDGLKKFYSYQCQICGLSIGEPYGTSVAHTHHIEYFCKSLNNDAANIMIVCPNHHGIIHSVNPLFDWEHKQFIYSNGFKEGLRLNKHL